VGRPTPGAPPAGRFLASGPPGANGGGGPATARPRPALGAAPSEGTTPGRGALRGRADWMPGQRYVPGREPPPPTLHAPPPTHAQGREGRRPSGLTTPHGSLRPVMRVRVFGAPCSASGSKNPPLWMGGVLLSLISRSGIPGALHGFVPRLRGVSPWRATCGATRR